MTAPKIRTIYLVRHAQPAGGDGPRRCSSPADTPLDEIGQHQAALLGQWARTQPLTAVWASPLTRAQQTAAGLSEGCLPIHTHSDLQELNSGVWEALTFDEIRRRWPAEYAARGQAIGTTPPPGGESFQDAGLRMERAIRQILAQSEGSIAIVSHGGISRGWLCRLLDWDANRVMEIRQPWAGITTLSVLPSGVIQPHLIGVQAFPWPDSVLQAHLFQRCQTPEHVQAHGRAVARCALELAQQISQPVDTKLLEAACLLHDLMRTSPQHAQAGAKVLNRDGYPQLADLVAGHHDLPSDAPIESCLLYLADKLIQGESRVDLDERFLRSRVKCTTPEALQSWSRRYEDAQRIQQHFHLDLK